MTITAKPQLPLLPAALPRSQPDWQAVVNVMQGWRKGLQTHKWIAPTLLNSWVYYGSPYTPPGYYMDAAGRVHLRGLVKNGSAANATIFQLPAPYAPSYTFIVPTVAADAFCEVRIDTSGNVTATTGGSVSWTSLDSISFDTTP